MLVVCASLSESAAARRVFLPAACRPAVTGSGGAVKMAVTIGGISEQKTQPSLTSLR